MVDGTADTMMLSLRPILSLSSMAPRPPAAAPSVKMEPNQAACVVLILSRGSASGFLSCGMTGDEKTRE